MFLNAGRNLLSDDMYYQQEEMRQLSVFLNEKRIYRKKESCPCFLSLYGNIGSNLTFLKAMYSRSHFFL